MRIRSKLVTLIAVPLIALMLIGAVGFARQSRTIEVAEESSAAARDAGLVEKARLAIGNERIVLASGAGGGEIKAARVATDEAVAALQGQVDSLSPESSAELLEVVERSRRAPEGEAMGLLADGLGILQQASTESTYDNLDSVERTGILINELAVDALHAREEAWFDYFALGSSARVTPQEMAEITNGFAEAAIKRDLTIDLAESSVIEGFSAALLDADVAELSRLEATATDDLAEGQISADRTGVAEALQIHRQQWTESVSDQRRLNESSIEGQLSGANDLRSLFTLLAVLGLVVLAGLVFVMYRSITRPLDSLLVRASAVADEELPSLMEALRHADRAEDMPTAQRIPVETDDEIGELVAAFNNVQTTAYDLATEQALSRRNVADMFVNLGRRNQQLLQRILKLLTRLERNEEDPDKLAELFQLDNIVTRMRRNAESLLALAGAQSARQWSKPISMENTVRAAFGEVDGYERIEVVELVDASVSGSAVADATHLLAELLENALNFSQPETRVVVSGRPTADNDYLITVSDRGIGMTSTDLAENNARITDPPPLDQVPTRFLGLYVVGRLADRHGISVRLTEGEHIGTVAKVLLPAAILAGESNDQPTLVDTAQGSDLIIEDGDLSVTDLDAPVIDEAAGLVDEDPKEFIVEPVSNDHSPLDEVHDYDAELAALTGEEPDDAVGEETPDASTENEPTPVGALAAEATTAVASVEAVEAVVVPEPGIADTAPESPAAEAPATPTAADVAEPAVSDLGLPVRRRGQTLSEAQKVTPTREREKTEEADPDSAQGFSSMLSAFSAGVNQAAESRDSEKGNNE